VLKKLVSPEGIVPARKEAKPSCGAPDEFRAKQTPERSEGDMSMSLNFASWNQLERWFRDIDALRRAA
jgi:hypothetical protein